MYCTSEVSKKRKRTVKWRIRRRLCWLVRAVFITYIFFSDDSKQEAPKWSCRSYEASFISFHYLIQSSSFSIQLVYICVLFVHQFLSYYRIIYNCELLDISLVTLVICHVLNVNIPITFIGKALFLIYFQFVSYTCTH